MQKSQQSRRNTVHRGLSVAASLTLAGGTAGPVFAQDAQADQSTAAQERSAVAPDGQLEEVVVTGYRASLNQALDDKRTEIGAVDSIRAEDIAKFPDLNLSESIQRIPGVAIERDAGEGRRISVRGLGPQFTRIRINGMEALATTGASDASGGTNRERQFDFNVFASELFNAITVRKTSSAELEEGSLGATVDLRVARPFDYKGFTFVTSAQGGYNDLVDKVNPRAALLVSDTFLDGKFGALLSAAYSEKDLLEEGSSTVRWQNSGTCPASPVGASCFTVAAPGYTLQQLNAAFRPRIPRYETYRHDQDRLGLTGSLQFQPTDSTLFSLDALYSKLNATRTEAQLEAPVFSTTGASAINEVKPRSVVIDSNNTMVYGSFDDVDIRSELRRDELSTEFKQLTLEGEQQLTDALKLHAQVGRSESNFDNPIQTTLIFDATNVDGYSFDFRNSNRLPAFSYGTANVTDPATWKLSQVRLRPQSADNTFDNALLDVQYDLTERFQIKAGGQYKKFEFESTELRRTNGTTNAPESTIPTAISASAANVAAYSRTISLDGSGLGVPGGTPTTWLVADLSKAADLLHIYDQSIFPLGTQAALGNNNAVDEKDTSGFVQMDFTVDVLGKPLRANVGLRYVKTDQTSTGYTFTSGSPLLQTIGRSYSDTLPSLNLVTDITDELLVRFAAAKVMARPNLANINPGAQVSITGNNKTVTAGNPYLDPFRANAYDLGVEWYFAKESLLGAALFFKDVQSFVQTIRITGPFSGNSLGLPDSVALAVCGASVPAATCLQDWQFNLPANTPGGHLKGLELSYQQPFSFLPAPYSNFGTTLNYTYVDSKIQYVGPNAQNVNVVVAEAQLTGLSKNSANATLYYDNGRFSARVSGAYRSDYLTTVPGRNSNDVEGTRSTLNVDFSSSWSFNDHLDFTLEALNLSDEYADQYVDSSDRLSVYHHTGRQYFMGARLHY